MAFIQLVGSLENASGAGLSIDAGYNISVCNEYCHITENKLNTGLNRWLKTSGISDIYTSRSHCVDTILYVGDTVQQSYKNVKI